MHPLVFVTGILGAVQDDDVSYITSSFFQVLFCCFTDSVSMVVNGFTQSLAGSDPSTKIRLISQDLIKKLSVDGSYRSKC